MHSNWYLQQCPSGQGAGVRSWRSRVRVRPPSLFAPTGGISHCEHSHMALPPLGASPRKTRRSSTSPLRRRLALARVPGRDASQWHTSKRGTPRNREPRRSCHREHPLWVPRRCDWTQCAASPAVGSFPQRALPRGHGPLRVVPAREHAVGTIAVARRACGDLAPGGLRARGGLAPRDPAHREGSGAPTAPSGPFSPFKRDRSHRPVGRIPGSGDSSQQPWHASPARGRGPSGTGSKNPST